MWLFIEFNVDEAAECLGGFFASCQSVKVSKCWLNV